MNDQFLTELQNVMGGSGIFMEERFVWVDRQMCWSSRMKQHLRLSLHSVDSIMCHILLSEMAVICLWETRESVVW